MNIKDVVKENLEVVAGEDGVFSILYPTFKDQLHQFLQRYTEIAKQQNPPTIPFTEYPNLPFSNAATGEQWRFRRSSYKVLNKLLKNESPKQILEIAGWNGWLTHHLVRWGHEVISCDIFADEVNGLSAKKHYKEEWLSIQADTSRLDFFTIKFDVIVVNHCLAYMQDPLQFISQLQPLLSDNGKIILMGICLFKNPDRKKKATRQFKQYYREKFGFDIFLRETKGYLDFSDQVQLESLGFAFYEYSDYQLRNILSSFVSTKPKYLYGIYTSGT